MGFAGDSNRMVQAGIFTANRVRVQFLAYNLVAMYLKQKKNFFLMPWFAPLKSKNNYTFIIELWWELNEMTHLKNLKRSTQSTSSTNMHLLSSDG